MSSNSMNKITTINNKLRPRLMLQQASHSSLRYISPLKIKTKHSNNNRSLINSKIINRTISTKIITKEISRTTMVNTIIKSKTIFNIYVIFFNFIVKVTWLTSIMDTRVTTLMEVNRILIVVFSKISILNKIKTQVLTIHTKVIISIIMGSITIKDLSSNSIMDNKSNRSKMMFVFRT